MPRREPIVLRSGGWLLVAIVVCGCRAPQAQRAQTEPAPANRPAADAAPPAAPPEPNRAGCSDDDEPREKPRPERERPFVEWIPNDDVPLTRTKPDHPVRFGNVVCKVNADVWRDAEGRVRVCTVAQKTGVFGLEIAAGAYSHFHEDGRPYQTHIARPQVLSTAAGLSVHCAADLVVVDRSGALEHCDLEKSANIGTVACRAGEGVAFHPKGALAAAVLDRATHFSGVLYPAGTRLYWYPSGALSGGWLRDSLRIAGYLVQYQFALHENGRLHVLELAEPRVIQGQSFPARAKLELRRDGTLRYAEYQTDSGFMPHGEQWTDTKHVRFDCDGRVSSESTEHWQAPHPPHPFKR